MCHIDEPHVVCKTLRHASIVVLYVCEFFSTGIEWRRVTAIRSVRPHACMCLTVQGLAYVNPAAPNSMPCELHEHNPAGREVPNCVQSVKKEMGNKKKKIKI